MFVKRSGEKVLDLAKIIKMQSEKFELFRALAESMELVPSYLVFGSKGVGKKKVVVAFLKMIFCENKQEGLPCGSCSHCLKLDRLSHENVYWITPKDKSDTIKVSQIRELRDFISLRYENKSFVVIDRAERLNLQSSNSLLKMLEEPPENIHFILITNSIGSVIATIRSRCQKIRFPLLSKSSLKELKPGFENWQYDLSKGSLFRLNLITEENSLAIKLRAEETLKKVESSYPHELTEIISNSLESREDLELYFYFLQELIKSLLLYKSGESISFPHLALVYQNLIRYEDSLWNEVLFKIQSVINELNFNFDKSLLLEDFVYTFCQRIQTYGKPEEFYLWN
jgi:DNA polymerase III delta prime subunit